MLTTSCNKTDNNNNLSSQVPVLTTEVVSNITQNTATCGGNVTSQGTDIVTARGVCWGTSQNPTVLFPHTTDGSGNGNFTSSLTALNPNTPYYVRAYATNSTGTGYGDQVSFTTQWITGGTVTDIDGNVYHTVTIGAKGSSGSQVWMAENLKTTRYNDGTSIPLVTDNSAWRILIAPGYCWYNNDAPTYKNTYGALYNFYTVNTGKLCPTEWHVPSDTEWTVLTNFLGGEDVAAGKMKSNGTIEAGTGLWYAPNAGATNESGFTGFPSGYRVYTGTFGEIGYQAQFWSSTEFNFSDVWFRGLQFNFAGMGGGTITKPAGLSVRCLKNN